MKTATKRSKLTLHVETLKTLHSDLLAGAVGGVSGPPELTKKEPSWCVCGTVIQG